MRGYNIERVQIVQPVFSPVTEKDSAPPDEKPPVLLHREDPVNKYPGPKVPVEVIWIAAACIVGGVIVWAIVSSVQTRRRVELLERTVHFLAQKQGFIFQRF